MLSDLIYVAINYGKLFPEILWDTTNTTSAEHEEVLFGDLNLHEIFLIYTGFTAQIFRDGRKVCYLQVLGYFRLN